MNTSISVNSDIFKFISEFSDNYNISRSVIVKTLLITIIGKIHAGKVKFRLTEYSDNFSCSKSKILHYSISEVLYVLSVQTRIDLRISVSKLVCASFLLFWDIVVAELLGKEEKQDKIEIWNMFLDSYEEFMKNSVSLYFYFAKRLKINLLFEIKTSKILS